MDPESSVRDLLNAALDGFDSPGNSVSASARRALRIAALRRDYVNQLWLQWELTDLTAGQTQKWQDPAIQRIKDQLDKLVGAAEGRSESLYAFTLWERNRGHIDGGQAKYLCHSLGQLEQRLTAYRRGHDDLEVPLNLTPADTYQLTKATDSAKADLLPVIEQHEITIERIRSAIHTFLVATECELDDGQAESSVFLRAQDYINKALARHAPTSLDKFLAAQQRMYSGSSEDLAHALTSCRRMIKALADAVYPPTDEVITGVDGIDRKMSDDLYRNRLLQYVRERIGKHAHGRAIQDSLDSLGARLKSLDSLASKGVHDEVTRVEAETCVMWTYFLAADIVRIADGTSGLLVQEDLTTPDAEHETQDGS